MNSKIARLALNDLVIPTLAAYIWTLPIIIYYFDVVSLIAPVANAIIAPLIPLAMLTGFITGLWHMIFPQVEIISFFAWLVLATILKLIKLTASVPWAQISITGLSSSGVLILYTLLIVITKKPWVVLVKNKKEN